LIQYNLKDVPGFDGDTKMSHFIKEALVRAQKKSDFGESRSDKGKRNSNSYTPLRSTTPHEIDFDKVSITTEKVKIPSG